MSKIESMEENQTYETWDIKKILTGLILLVILGLSFKVLVMDKKSSNVASVSSQNVQGVSTQATPSSIPVSSDSLKTTVQTNLDNLKKEVNNINVVEIATSAPAVQKVISDIKSLEQAPQNQAKQVCLQICNGL